MTEPLARKSRHCFFFGVVTDELIQKMKETKQKKTKQPRKEIPSITDVVVDAVEINSIQIESEHMRRLDFLLKSEDNGDELNCGCSVSSFFFFPLFWRWDCWNSSNLKHHNYMSHLTRGFGGRQSQPRQCDASYRERLKRFKASTITINIS